jgi:cytochrome c oxidase cbb3-type subunit III
MAEKNIDEISGVETTGHEWDGIQELNNPLPRWWLWTFYATIVWAIAYTIAYPAWPLLKENTKGMLGFSSRQVVAEDIAKATEAQKVFLDKIAAMPVADIAKDQELSQFAMNGGAAAFKVNCAPCHGSGASGGPGFPNLSCLGAMSDRVLHPAGRGNRDAPRVEARAADRR